MFLIKTWFINCAAEVSLQSDVLEYNTSMHPHSVDILEFLTFQWILHGVGVEILHSRWEAEK
jgi:hypothetical protein